MNPYRGRSCFARGQGPSRLSPNQFSARKTITSHSAGSHEPASQKLAPAAAIDTAARAVK